MCIHNIGLLTAKAEPLLPPIPIKTFRISTARRSSVSLYFTMSREMTPKILPSTEGYKPHHTWCPLPTRVHPNRHLDWFSQTEDTHTDHAIGLSVYRRTYALHLCDVAYKSHVFYHPIFCIIELHDSAVVYDARPRRFKNRISERKYHFLRSTHLNPVLSDTCRPPP